MLRAQSSTRHALGEASVYSGMRRQHKLRLELGANSDSVESGRQAGDIHMRKELPRDMVPKAFISLSPEY
jgi:hypothetical protein